jgi:hypothetical protein
MYKFTQKDNFFKENPEAYKILKMFYEAAVTKISYFKVDFLGKC